MSEYDDSHMLSKVLERMSAQAAHLKDKIDSGLEIPSWAEYKVYNAYSGLGSALGTAYPGEYPSDSMVVKAAAHCMTKRSKKKAPPMMKKKAADWSQYDVDDVHAAGRIAEDHITDDPSELAKKIHAGLLKDPTHPKHAPSMVPLGAVGGGVLGAGLGYPLSFIPKMRYAPAVTGAAGALLGGLTGHKVTKDLRGAEGDRIHQEALATQKRRLANSALMGQLSRDVAEDYLRPMDELMDKESAATFSKSMDKHPALKGKQSQLPDKVQAGIIKKNLKKEAEMRIHDGLSRETLLAEQNRARRALAGKSSHEALTPAQMALATGTGSGLAGLFTGGPVTGLLGASVGGAMGYYGTKRYYRDRDAKIEQILSKQASGSTESQVLKALSAEGGAAGMGALKKRVKEDDLQSAIKTLIASGKVRKHPDGDLIKESAAGRLPHEDEGDYAERMLHESGDIVSRRYATPEQMKKYFSGAKKGTQHRKEAAATATKTDPAKWEAAKREAKAKMGGKHSARAMQVATNIYKKKGGGYSGAKPTSKNNSLKKWTKQKWNWSGGDKPGPGGKGVYLPKKKAEGLKKTESGRKRLAAASRKKSEATRKGQQYSSHGLAKGTSLKAKK